MILIVDDQHDALKLLQLRLQSAGMQCFPASSGKEALQVLEKQSIDVVILDIMMPEMDGFEVCRRIKSNEKTKDIPVLFLTAKMEVSDRVKGLELGGHDFLCKPVEQQELLARTKAAYRVKQLQVELKQLNQIQEFLLASHWDSCLGQLATSLAHEINNPLTAALGNTELLLLSIDTPPLKSRLDDTKTSVGIAADKLKSLLAIAQPHEKQSFDISSIVNNVIALTNYRTLSHQTKVTTNMATGGKWYGSPTYTARAIFYIINHLTDTCDNSCSKIITIEGKFSSERYHLSLSNNSATPRKETMSHAFSRLTPRGDGIGLYLANKLIQNENGQLLLKEKVGTPGIVFDFWLPSTC
jgi:DNA-binding response OmpR family regulator